MVMTGGGFIIAIPHSAKVQKGLRGSAERGGQQGAGAVSGEQTPMAPWFLFQPR